jgi:hypothetical protein
MEYSRSAECDSDTLHHLLNLNWNGGEAERDMCHGLQSIAQRSPKNGNTEVGSFANVHAPRLVEIAESLGFGLLALRVTSIRDL